MSIPPELLDQLVNSPMAPEELQLERAMGTAMLADEGPIRFAVRRDLGRDRGCEPISISKGERHSEFVRTVETAACCGAPSWSRGIIG